eukprot:TRINITY_DN14846_c0_g1_i5.p1 TRINITY_DN14846_c0_g1~~TRINITY_DN14846_c0_g1_i5.p1  ORF type:complete len:358 (+),score=109.43 TRINITY_DN14846_c0_g1_i5:69-1076(+)
MALQMQLPVPMRQLKVNGAGQCGVPPGVFLDGAGAMAAHMGGVSFHEESPLFKQTPNAFDECCSPNLRSSPVAFRDMVYQPYQSPMTAYFDGLRKSYNFGMGSQQQQTEQEPAQQEKHLRNHAVAPPAQMQAAQPLQLSMSLACPPQPQQMQQIQQQPQQQSQVTQQLPQQQMRQTLNQQQQQPQQLPQACAMPVAFPFPAFQQPAFYGMAPPAAVAGANSKGMAPSTQQAWQQAAEMASAMMGCAVQQKGKTLPVPESRPAISFAAAAAMTKATANVAEDTNTKRQNSKDMKNAAQTQSRKAAVPRDSVPTAVYIDLSSLCEKALTTSNGNCAV